MSNPAMLCRREQRADRETALPLSTEYSSSSLYRPIPGHPISYLRRSDINPARHSWAILALLVKTLRQHCGSKVDTVSWATAASAAGWCCAGVSSHQVRYILGIPKNARLKAQTSE